MTKTQILLAALLFAGCTQDNPIHNAVRELHGGGERLLARYDTDGDGTEIIAAAQRAGVHELILRLPQGYAGGSDPRKDGMAAGH